MNTEIKKPNSARHLDMAIRRLVSDKPNPEFAFVEYRDLLANAIVAQLMPEAVIKGGSSLKLRYGIDNTRYTTDFDISYISNLESFIEAFQNNLQSGVHGFTGRIIAKKPAHPKNIAFEYVMKPFEIKLSYRGRPWCTVIFETGQNEIGNAEQYENCNSAEVNQLFVSLGFEPPKSFHLMTLPYQIAQKLHGLTEPDSLRIHDLIDLQLIFNKSSVDFAETKKVCERLFKYRKQQKWPPVINLNKECRELYLDKSRNLYVINDYDKALEWLKQIINNICKAPD